VLDPNPSLLKQATRISLQAEAVTNAVYGVLILAAGLLLRRLQARMLVLLIVTIVGIAFPAMLGLNLYLEWGRMPAWQVIIPIWLGLPAAAWATLTLFRREVRDAFGRTRATLESESHAGQRQASEVKIDVESISGAPGAGDRGGRIARFPASVCAWQLIVCLLGLIPAAVPINVVEHGLWGVGFSSSSSSGPGISVDEIQPGSAAYVAGLRDGDQVLAINDSKVRASDDLSRCWMELPFGTLVDIHLVRGGQPTVLRAARGPDALAAQVYLGYQVLAGFTFLALFAVVFSTLRRPGFALWRGGIVCAAASLAVVVALSARWGWGVLEGIQLWQTIAYGGVGQSAPDHFQRLTILGIAVLLVLLGLLDLRSTLRREPKLRIDTHEGAVAVVGGLAFAMSVVWAIISMIHPIGTMCINYAAVPLIVLATVGATTIYFRHWTAPPSGWKAEVPEMTLLFLGAAAGALPWSMTGFLSCGTAWFYWHGAAFSLIYLALTLATLIGGGLKRSPAWLGAIILAGGLCAFGIAIAFGNWPPSVGPAGFRVHASLRNCQLGYFIAAAIAVATTLLGAIQLRRALSTIDNTE
jgi:hypothetical protein